MCTSVNLHYSDAPCDYELKPVTNARPESKPRPLNVVIPGAAYRRTIDLAVKHIV